MPTEEPILYSVENAVALITLNRPDRLNAWTAELERQYLARLDEAARDPVVRAAVVTGAGRGYCGGADMAELRDLGDAGSRPVEEMQSAPLLRTIAFPKPLIAAINGACAGLGLVQALACDLRFAAAGAKLTTIYARRGLVAEDGTAWLLPRLVGVPASLDLLLSGRIVLAEEACELGLVNRVLPPEEMLPAALEYARDLAENCSPASMATIKRQIWRHLTTDLETAMAETAPLVVESLGTADFREGIASFAERRPPRFASLVYEDGA